MDRPKMLENLIALIDSGTATNLELALNLSVNLPDEWQWIHKYLKSKNSLPSHLRSWYAAYAEYVKYDHDRVRIDHISHYDKSVTLNVSQYTIYYMNDIIEGVALELHWLLFRKDFFELKQQTRQMEFKMRPTFAPYASENEPKPEPIALIEQIANLLPR